LLSAAGEEDFDDGDDTGVLPASEVKNLKAELKEVNASWKATLKELKSLLGSVFVELNTAGHIPKGLGKGFYCTEGLTAKDPQFANAQRIAGDSDDAKIGAIAFLKKEKAAFTGK
jgi:type I restriction enzyme M protein